MRDSDSGPVISLFSGAGGCSLGFATAGLRPSFAADNDAQAAATYSENLRTECSVLDLSDPQSVETVVARTGGIAPFFIVGGPPCQGFSTAGPRRSDDPRNRLIFNYLEIVQRTSPRWFLFENVEGILTSNGGKDIVELVQAFSRLGYVVRLEKLNFAALGVPQTRKRVIIVGNRVGMAFRMPDETHAYNSGKSKLHSSKPFAPSLAEAISDLPPSLEADAFAAYPQTKKLHEFASRMRKDSDGVWHHYAKPSKEVAAIAPFLKPGQTMKHLPPDLQHESYKRRANRRVMDGTPTEKRGGAPAGYKRLVASFNSLTITSAATREFLHPTEDRPLTLRECARVQTFPDTYRFRGNAASIAKQIGNAIPPLAAERLALHFIAQDGLAGGDSSPPPRALPGLLSFRLTDASGMSPALETTNRMLTALQDDSHLPLLKAISNA